MTRLFCTRKLTARSGPLAKWSGDTRTEHPMGDWHADLFFAHRHPIILLLNHPTGATLLAPARAALLAALPRFAAAQLNTLFQWAGIDTPLARTELHAWLGNPISVAPAADRSAIALMNRCKLEVKDQILYNGDPPAAIMADMWRRPFKAKGMRNYGCAVQLVRECLGAPAGKLPEWPFRG